MQRRTFLISSAGSFALAGAGRTPALASFVDSRPRTIRIALKRHAAGATPGGCANRSRRSEAYTLNFALTGRR